MRIVSKIIDNNDSVFNTVQVFKPTVLKKLKPFNNIPRK